MILWSHLVFSWTYILKEILYKFLDLLRNFLKDSHIRWCVKHPIMMKQLSMVRFESVWYAYENFVNVQEMTVHVIPSSSSTEWSKFPSLSPSMLLPSKAPFRGNSFLFLRAHLQNKMTKSDTSLEF